MNTQSVEQLPDDDAVESTQDDSNQAAPSHNEVEKGSGYGPPNEGSGETVNQKDVSPDGKPIQENEENT
ncbi:hypothetical protein [Mucilaginibacter sp. HD30]